VAKKTVKKTLKKKTKSVSKKTALKKTAKKAAPRPAAKPGPPKGPVWQWSAVETAAAIRSGAVSAVEVVEAHLARMRAVNPKLNAVVVDLSEEALKAAKAADGAAARRNAGLLHGVPITIKENADYAGRPNPNGVPAQMSIIAPSDAPVVRNLKNAGAIVIGLTNTPEFSFRGFTDNPLHGLTLNPWDPEITCGGSSGGAVLRSQPVSAPSRTATTSAAPCAGRRIATGSRPSSRPRAASPPITRARRPNGRCSRI
jgi:amidase